MRDGVRESVKHALYKTLIGHTGYKSLGRSNLGEVSKAGFRINECLYDVYGTLLLPV
jgi:hypothetical protein